MNCASIWQLGNTRALLLYHGIPLPVTHPTSPQWPCGSHSSSIISLEDVAVTAFRGCLARSGAAGVAEQCMLSSWNGWCRYQTLSGQAGTLAGNIEDARRRLVSVFEAWYDAEGAFLSEVRILQSRRSCSIWHPTNSPNKYRVCTSKGTCL